MEQFFRPLHLACVNDETRVNLSLIEIKNGIATATNAHILVKMELLKTSIVEPDQLKVLEGKFIHMEVWKEIHKCDSLLFHEEYIECHKNGIKKIFEYSESQGTFFNTNQIVIDIKEAGEIDARIITYNPHYINTIYKIFGGNALHFSFTGSNKGTIVFPEEYSGMMAVLMPIDSQVKNRYIFY